MEELKNSKTWCPRCLADVVSTDWRAPEGIDPNMREFVCQNAKCGYKFYKVIYGSHKREKAFQLGI